MLYAEEIQIKIKKKEKKILGFSLEKRKILFLNLIKFLLFSNNETSDILDEVELFSRS